MSVELFESEKMHIAKTLEEVVSLIESKANGHPERRVTEPFEAVIDRRTITVDSLRRYAALPIECVLYNDHDHNLFIATGKPRAGTADYDGYDELLQAAMQDVTLPEIRTHEYFAKVHNAFKDAADVFGENTVYSLWYTAHQHPNGQRVPSPADALSSQQKYNVDVEIIFTKDGLVFYRADKQQAESYYQWAMSWAMSLAKVNP
ncbi:MAG: hypothetical protein WA021_03445, partial [Minisyncoccia bacterium]